MKKIATFTSLSEELVIYFIENYVKSQSNELNEEQFNNVKDFFMDQGLTADQISTLTNIDL